MKRRMNLVALGSAVLTMVLTGCVGVGGTLSLDEDGLDADVTFHLTEGGQVQETVDSYAAISASAGGEARIAGQLDLGFEVEETLASLPDDAEVVFVIDTTGSMLWAIETVLDAVEVAMEAAPERRYGVVVYRDRGDVYVAKSLSVLGPDLDAALDGLSAAEAGGGGDFPEHVASGLDHALRTSPWGNASRHIVLIGDAPDHGYTDDTITLDGALELADELGVEIHTVAIACGLTCQEEIDLI